MNHIPKELKPMFLPTKLFHITMNFGYSVIFNSNLNPNLRLYISSINTSLWVDYMHAIFARGANNDAPCPWFLHLHLHTVCIIHINLVALFPMVHSKCTMAAWPWYIARMLLCNYIYP